MLGFISGRVTVTLTGNSDSWDVPAENKAAVFENQFNTHAKGFFHLSALGIVSSRLAARTSPPHVGGLYFPSLTRSIWLATVLHSPVVPSGHELILWRHK